MFGCNLRNLIKAPEGKKLVVADLSQIEVRTLCWLAGDKTILEEIRNSDDIYETFAITFKEWSKDKGELKLVDPATRHKVKTMVLGCGYGVGFSKFASISGMTEDEAKKAVNLYRRSMSTVVDLWKKYGSMLNTSCKKQLDFEIQLPSGRSLKYGKIIEEFEDDRKTRVNYIAMVVKNAARRPVKLYGGLLAENASQALARDVFSDCMLRMEQEGLKIVCHVHDEVLIECDAEEADEVLTKTLDIMKTPPKWIPDLPLDAEGKIVERYEK